MRYLPLAASAAVITLSLGLAAPASALATSSASACDPEECEELPKVDRERVKQASRDMLNSIKARLAELDRFWEKEQTKGEVEAFILDEIFIKLPSPPFTPEEKKLVADNVYAHVWQQAMSGGFARVA